MEAGTTQHYFTDKDGKDISVDNVSDSYEHKCVDSFIGEAILHGYMCRVHHPKKNSRSVKYRKIKNAVDEIERRTGNIVKVIKIYRTSGFSNSEIKRVEICMQAK